MAILLLYRGLIRSSCAFTTTSIKTTTTTTTTATTAALFQKKNANSIGVLIRQAHTTCNLLRLSFMIPLNDSPTTTTAILGAGVASNRFRFLQHSSIFSTRLHSTSSSSSSPSSSSPNNNNNNNKKENDKWVVPSYIEIPEDQLEFSFVRSSGSGGQNVNKVNSQVQIRFHVLTASWMGPYEVRQRFAQQQANRINKDGYLVLHAQEHRTQPQNRASVLHKLKTMILQAWPRPVQRKLRTGLSRHTKQERIEFKRRRSVVKESRRNVVDF